MAPAKIDPRFLNPNYVFKELEAKPPITVKDLLKSAEDMKKSKAEGYPEDMSILHTKLPASVFMASDSPAVLLQDAYEVIFRYFLLELGFHYGKINFFLTCRLS